MAYTKLYPWLPNTAWDKDEARLEFDNAYSVATAIETTYQAADAALDTAYQAGDLVLQAAINAIAALPEASQAAEIIAARQQHSTMLEAFQARGLDINAFSPVADGVTDDAAAFQAANDAATGKIVYVPDGNYKISDLTLDDCILCGTGQKVNFYLTGTVTIQETLEYVRCGKLWNINIYTAAGYANKAVKLTGYLNRFSNILDNVRIIGADTTTGSIGLFVEAEATNASHIKAVTANTFGDILIQGYEYGMKEYCNETAGVAYINSNIWKSIKIYNSKYLYHAEKAGTGEIIANIVNQLLLQASASTVDAFKCIGVSRDEVHINLWDFASASGDIINLDENTQYCTISLHGYVTDQTKIVNNGNNNIFIQRDRGRIIVDFFRQDPRDQKRIIVPQTGFTSAVVGSGATTAASFYTFINTGVTTGSQSLLYADVYGLASNGGSLNRVDFSKNIRIAFTLAVSGDDAGLVRYVQLKRASTHGDIANVGIGIKIANLTLYGESYRTERGEVELMTLTAGKEYLVVIEHFGPGKTVRWFVGGSQKGAQYTTTKVPYALADAAHYLVCSINNGAGTTDGYLYIAGMEIIKQE